MTKDSAIRKRMMLPAFLLLLPLMGGEIAGGEAGSMSHEYQQSVWHNWDTLELDVVVLGVHDAVIGAAIQDAITTWEEEVHALAPGLAPGLADLRLDVHWTTDRSALATLDFHILFVPQGYVAWAPVAHPSTGERVCVATAPLLVEVRSWPWGPNLDHDYLYSVAAHEFGHCLGLAHVFEHGVEYEPEFDIMGAGLLPDGSRPCPSNLNVLVLARVFAGSQGTVTMPSEEYFQSSC